MEQMNVKTNERNGMDLDGHSTVDLPPAQRDLEAGGEQNVLASVMVLGAMHQIDGRDFDIDAFLAGIKEYYEANKDDPKWAMVAQGFEEAKGSVDDGGAPLDALAPFMGAAGTDSPSGDGAARDPQAAALADLGSADGAAQEQQIEQMLEALGDNGVGDDDDVSGDDALGDPDDLVAGDSDRDTDA